ncbi:hypothetical protein BAY61_10085 [Prauserella marina]|uniref:Uncharacterized protein n=1 Tax=Prauserella marina TaxID=530584 RepID=A0A222VMZ1_9PSEU|nr:hypothetical protein [Prauserella marina]ASR35286.1 hypothetical protein BAY61_10085 [Prauserella marina]PWV84938.1 hypothetical protein DES30_101957 [Prauserella marina]SDC08868.1 hypothetical protein SAMN05421630_101380 [Prauserella marina]
MTTTEQLLLPREDADPVIADVVIGVADVLAESAGRLVLVLRPLTGGLLAPERWPRFVRELAGRGVRRRRQVGEAALRGYRFVTPVLVTDALDRLDLPGIVREVLAEIDLPEIIRTSTGSVASESVRDVRIRLVAADDAVSRRFGGRRDTAARGHDE